MVVLYESGHVAMKGIRPFISIACVARGTYCGLLDLSGTRRSACYKTPGK